MVSQNNFWQGKKVFLTGHTGFKGSWLSIWLKMLGADVTGYSLLPESEPNMYTVTHNDREMRSIIGDIRDITLLRKTIREVKPDIVIHMAAQALVRQSYHEPVETFQTNVLGTVNVLEAVRQIDSVRTVLCITSDKCYENREWVWKYRENDPMGGWDPYSASKGCSELIVASYRNSFFNNDLYDQHGVAVASARAGNVIGGGDWGADRLIPDIVRSFSEGKSVLIRNPGAVRPWQHVIDLLRGYMLLTERLYEKGPEYGEAWNFGPGDDDERSVREIVDSLAKLWGRGASWKLDTNEQLHEAYTLKLDSSKSRSRLSWHPLFSMDLALELVTEWYKQYYSGDKPPREITEEQIRRMQAQTADTKLKFTTE